ncbi:MAG TPA: hypothetical protein VJ896_03950 [Bacteroidales bacterium]|nr:hypothetical protein [Bacteroidales bacterium]
MENESKNTEEAKNFDVSLSESSNDYLKKTAPWMKFVSIVGFIMCGIMVIAGFVMMLNSGNTFSGSNIGIGAGFLYLVGAVIFFIINRFLFLYANGVNKVYKLNDYDALETAFKMQKNFWKIVGIFFIIYISLIAIAMVFFALGDIFQPF